MKFHFEIMHTTCRLRVTGDSVAVLKFSTLIEFGVI